MSKRKCVKLSRLSEQDRLAVDKLLQASPTSSVDDAQQAIVRKFGWLLDVRAVGKRMSDLDLPGDAARVQRVKNRQRAKVRTSQRSKPQTAKELLAETPKATAAPAAPTKAVLAPEAVAKTNRATLACYVFQLQAANDSLFEENQRLGQDVRELSQREMYWRGQLRDSLSKQHMPLRSQGHVKQSVE